MSKEKFRMEESKVYSRPLLSVLMGLDDRTMRNKIREMRRNGIPVVAVKGGGYKIAETDVEKRQLLHMYRKRAMDELVTYRQLEKTLQLDGQVSVEELLEEAE